MNNKSRQNQQISGGNDTLAAKDPKQRDLRKSLGSRCWESIKVNSFLVIGIATGPHELHVACDASTIV